eukprot:2238902-Prymnesium_polylepis.1
MAIKVQAQVADLSQQVRDNPSVKVAEEMALRAGQLSGARVCQALIQGEMQPTTFAACVADMPRELLHGWLDKVRLNPVRLSVPLVRPHVRVLPERRLRSSAFAQADPGAAAPRQQATNARAAPPAQMALHDPPHDARQPAEGARHLTASAMRARGIAAAAHSHPCSHAPHPARHDVRRDMCAPQDARRDMEEGQRAVTDILLSLDRTMRQSRRARALWNKALLAAIIQVRNDRNRLLRSVEVLGAGPKSRPADSLQHVADVVCETTWDAARCGQVTLFVQDPRSPGFETSQPALHRLVAARTASAGAPPAKRHASVEVASVQTPERALDAVTAHVLGASQPKPPPPMRPCSTAARPPCRSTPPRATPRPSPPSTAWRRSPSSRRRRTRRASARAALPKPPPPPPPPPLADPRRA